MVAGINSTKEHIETMGGLAIFAAAAAVGVYFISGTGLSIVEKVAASVAVLAIPVFGITHYGGSLIKDAVRRHQAGH